MLPSASFAASGPSQEIRTATTEIFPTMTGGNVWFAFIGPTGQISVRLLTCPGDRRSSKLYNGTQ